MSLIHGKQKAQIMTLVCFQISVLFSGKTNKQTKNTEYNEPSLHSVQ